MIFIPVYEWNWRPGGDGAPGAPGRPGATAPPGATQGRRGRLIIFFKFWKKNFCILRNIEFFLYTKTMDWKHVLWLVVILHVVWNSFYAGMTTLGCVCRVFCHVTLSFVSRNRTVQKVLKPQVSTKQRPKKPDCVFCVNHVFELCRSDPCRVLKFFFWERGTCIFGMWD